MADKNLHRVFMTVVITSIGWLFLTVSDLKVGQKLMQYQIGEIMTTMRANTDTLTIIHDKLHDEFGG